MKKLLSIFLTLTFICTLAISVSANDFKGLIQSSDKIPSYAGSVVVNGSNGAEYDGFITDYSNSHLMGTDEKAFAHGATDYFVDLSTSELSDVINKSQNSLDQSQKIEFKNPVVIAASSIIVDDNGVGGQQSVIFKDFFNEFPKYTIDQVTAVHVYKDANGNYVVEALSKEALSANDKSLALTSQNGLGHIFFFVEGEGVVSPETNDIPRSESQLPVIVIAVGVITLAFATIKKVRN